jgi:aromatic-L-amino-acid decarboxylase
MAPTPLSVVCFRAHPRGIHDEEQLNTINEHLMGRINTAGHFFLSHTKIHGKIALRIAIGNIRTTEKDVHEVWKELQTALHAELRSIKGLWAGSRQGILRMLNLPSRPPSPEKL